MIKAVQCLIKEMMIQNLGDIDSDVKNHSGCFLHLFNVQKLFFFSCYPKILDAGFPLLQLQNWMFLYYLSNSYLFRHEWQRNCFTESSGQFSNNLFLNIFIKALLGSIGNKNISIILVKLFLLLISLLISYCNIIREISNHLKE